METINERVEFIIRSKGYNRVQFANLLKVTPQYINKIASAGGSVGIEPVTNIVRLFPDVNARWLLIGEGDPFLLPDKAEKIRRNVSGRIDFLFSIEKYIPVMDPEDLSYLEVIINTGSFDSFDYGKIAVWEERINLKTAALNERVAKAMEASICKTKSDKI